MVSLKRVPLVIPAVALLLACGGEQPEEDEMRDLTLAPAESVVTIGDVPEPEVSPTPPPQTQTRQPPRQQRQQPPPRQPEPEPQPQPRAPSFPTVGAGTAFNVFATDTIASRVNKVGDAVTATLGADVLDANGELVIPAGAVFMGSIAEIAPAPNPDADGTLVIAFTQVAFGGKTYAVEADQGVTEAYTKGRGLEASQAATVGAGAVIGGIAGRVIGGNKTGTIVGAAAGAIAGAGIASATRDEDVILNAGGAINIVLRRDFVLEPIAGT